ncbi:CO(2)-response secreted protease [Cryptomeria japonica]|uniref:CO(2)-response secreted protease n=1 Tax=Cryptomeria japonica TaxID=3369 RepID=UPI0025AC1F71|nr:CO(2)-response secreted protease [Cryptomeria japonica]
MGFIFHFQLVLFCSLILGSIASDANEEDEKMYVVYMGSSREKERDLLVRSHVQLLSSVWGSRNQAEESLVNSYTYAFTGFSAKLSSQQASALADKPGVVSVFPDPILELHTTQSWDFLQMQLGTSFDYPNVSSSDQDAIIGLLDTGVWPESASFNDVGIAATPRRWKGACMQGKDFTVSNCNRKLIGAWYNKATSKSKTVFTKSMTARDSNGHGTHTASTAGGNAIANANYYGLAKGTARGGSTSSRIAIYRVCTEEGCLGSNILAAFDNAVNDGVDILSLSLGSSSTFIPYTEDPIAIGAFHATQKGILVVCSAGNNGPDRQSVVNTAPWIFTVAATTINRQFGSNVILGNGKTIQGMGINFSNLSQSKMYPLVDGGSVGTSSSSTDDSRNCNPDSLSASKLKGKVVLCLNTDTSYGRQDKKGEVKNKRGIAMILADDSQKSVAANYGTFPSTTVSNALAKEILSYIKSTKNPVATISPTEDIQNYKPAPVIPYFSSRGPATQTENILKPDISAPGVNILASWIPTSSSSGDVPMGMKPSLFNIISGTSMACPHVSGAAALLKTVHPAWSSSALRSALITTATPMNNVGSTMTDDTDAVGTPFDFGGGEINPRAALEPGLVYETSNQDYFDFLCNSGLDSDEIKSISGNANYKCPSNAAEESISLMNYPTISLTKLNVGRIKTVSRTVGNVSPNGESTYKVSIDAPAGLTVSVSPDTLYFTSTSNKLSFNVMFKATSAKTDEYLFGSLTWVDGKHTVRTPFVVNVA